MKSLTQKLLALLFVSMLLVACSKEDTPANPVAPQTESPAPMTPAEPAPPAEAPTPPAPTNPEPQN